MAKSPTVYDVAERAGVSIATVSFAFRRPEKVKPSTREAVLAAARELGYVPSASARGLADGRTRALGLFSFDYLLDAPDHHAEPGTVPPTALGAPTADLNEDLRLFPLYVDEVQRGVELECWRRGYALMVGGRGQENTETVVADIAGRVDGIAVFPHTVPTEVLHRISRRIPVVELSQPSRDDDLNHVTVDNARGMRQLINHLTTEHRLTRFQFLGDTSGFDQQARFRAFRSALRAAGSPVPRASLSPPRATARHAAEVIDRLLRHAELPQALVCVTDQDALAAMDALGAAGVVVPDDIVVTGFDGIAAGRVVRPGLTTVRQPMEAMGRTVVDILLERLTYPERPPISRKLPVSLALRESCGCRRPDA